MKGDIAVAGFMMTAEEWEALDSVSRAQLVAVITRREDPFIAAGSGPTVVAPRFANASIPPGLAANAPLSPSLDLDRPVPVLAEGTNPNIELLDFDPDDAA
jgi:hypothetical protein